jgi:hypothetical protein
MNAIPDYLLSQLGCENGICCNLDCPEAVKEAPTGRFYITMGHPGFNSPANNRSGSAGGYATRKAALAAFHRYATR